MNKILTYGIKEQNVFDDEIDFHVENILNKGYSVINNLYTKEETLSYRKKLDVIYEIQKNEIGGSDNLKSINDEFIVRLPLSYNDEFLEMAKNIKVINILNKLLGDYYILMLQNGIINMPSEFNYQASWHRDLNYQHFVSSRPLSISVLHCLDNFTKLTGGTYFLPGSQKSEKFLSEKYILENEITVEAEEGSVFLFDSMLFHRAGHNTSNNIRRGVNHMYCLPFIKQQIDIPSALNGKFSDDSFLSRFLGYESRSGESVLKWRENKLKKA